MIAVEFTRVTKVVAYDTNVVKGSHATVFTSKPDDAYVIERKTIVNHGHVALNFPEDYHGECYVEVTGSREGTDSGTITV